MKKKIFYTDSYNDNFVIALTVILLLALVCTERIAR